MTTPAPGEFIISQGDSLPLLRVPIPANGAGQFPDPVGNHVTFLGRPVGWKPPGSGGVPVPPPIIAPMQSHTTETQDYGDGPVPVLALYFKLTSAQTASIETNKAVNFYVEMQGEVEFRAIANPANVLTVPSGPPAYLKWWIRDDIGDGA